MAIVGMAVTCLAGTAIPDAASAATGPARPELQNAIQAMVDSGLTGVQMRVDDQQGDWVGSAGLSRLDGTAKPLTDGRFRIGSATKTFTATVTLQLVAENKVGLDAPAAGYLPQFGLDPRITVRMLLQHTSGLFSYTGEYFPDGTVIPGIPWNGKAWVDNRFHTYRPEDLVRFALTKTPRFAPGTGWSYSNTNYALLRLLIEKVTGHSYATEVGHRILRPLKLRDTSVPGTSTAIPGPHAHSYYRYQDDDKQWKTVDVTRQNPSWISSGGEMISTTRDLHTFFSALLTGKLLPASLLAEMVKPHPSTDPIMGYGLGLEVQNLACGGTVYYADGGVQGAGTLMYSTPDGSRSMEASVTYVDSLNPPLGDYQKTVQRLVNLVFCKQ